MPYHFKIHKEGKGFWAECIELNGCYTQGATIKELIENIEDALYTYFDKPILISFSPIKESDSVIKIFVKLLPNAALAK